jgi:predicted SAM-dependent methyltransferase
MSISKYYYKFKERAILSYHTRFRKNKNPLKDLLIKNNQTRWIDIGSSISYNEGFYFIDIKEIEQIPVEMRSKYLKLNITIPLTDDHLNNLGRFDFIRMQHVFEHFTIEEGLVVLGNCYKLLNNNGYLLISVPDLKIFVKRYLNKSLDVNWPFADWARTRIPIDSPQSFYFSIYTHSVLHEKHLWCYDEAGLKYELQRSGKFKSVQRISLFNNLACIPFTHNRPLEDLCVLAQKT